MSWSVGFKGKASEARAALQSQFDSATSCVSWNPHEQQSVRIAEAAVNHELAYICGADPKSAEREVDVSAFGSCSIDGTTQTSIKVQPIYS
jgi:hypothetical protein